jgi:hypothetical protein
MKGSCEPSGFHKILGSSWVAAQLAALQEGLSSMSEWVSEWVSMRLITCTASTIRLLESEALCLEVEHFGAVKIVIHNAMKFSEVKSGGLKISLLKAILHLNRNSLIPTIYVKF